VKNKNKRWFLALMEAASSRIGRYSGQQETASKKMPVASAAKKERANLLNKFRLLLV
jgi:hypothetical protein